MRTSMSVLGLVALLAFVALVQQPGTASASVGWCLDDPTLVVNGRTVHINIGVPSDLRRSVDYVTLVVEVPSNVSASLSGTNAAQGTGILGVRSTLSFTGAIYSGTGPIPVTVTATVNSAVVMPTRLSAWQSSVGDRGDITGISNIPMVLLPISVQ